jgi:23S rRNA (guanosine2251-2'-O)-methyltransferase
VRELLRAGRRRVYSVTLAEGTDRSALLAEITDLAAEARVPVRWVSRERLVAMAVTDAAQGVIASADPIESPGLEDLLHRPASGPLPLLVVLDGVTDPHNLGAVLRSALAAGATGVVIGRHGQAGLTPTALKAAAGAAEHLPVAEVAGIPAALNTIRGAGVWTVGLDGTGPTSVWDLTVADEPVALVFGAEGRGLGRLVRERCEVVARIPLLGPIESLNVSAAAAVACFEVARRRQTTLTN